MEISFSVSQGAAVLLSILALVASVKLDSRTSVKRILWAILVRRQPSAI